MLTAVGFAVEKAAFLPNVGVCVSMSHMEPMQLSFVDLVRLWGAVMATAAVVALNALLGM